MSIPSQDAKLLRFAGLLGHPFASVCTPKDGRRFVRAETNSIDSAEQTFNDSDTDRAVYQRVNGKWIAK